MGNWNTPDGLRYTKEDEWIKMDGDQAIVGVTDYAQDQLSDVVYVEMPDIGEKFAADDVYGVIESVKAASDLFMPIGGQVTAINGQLEDTPELANDDPYDKGWIIRIKPDNPSDTDGLMDPQAYDAYCDERNA